MTVRKVVGVNYNRATKQWVAQTRYQKRTVCATFAVKKFGSNAACLLAEEWRRCASMGVPPSAHEESAMRTAALERKKIMEEKMREERLLEIANKARHDRNALAEDLKAAEDADVHKRKRLEEARNREIERDVRLNKSSRKGSGRDRDATRDVSEKVALGQPQPTSQEAQFDNRLFNQTAGMDSGFQGGDDEKYKVYDKPLFVDRTTAGLYRFDKDRMQQSVGEKGEMPSFSGAEQRPQRTAPVEFEKDKSDPFGLNKLL
eukprot:GHVU01147267.1.p1 GENE.GHVU01147267.1~~GHVU01147267.1.p1  ORF type:complete len:260 (-),score=62.72 GHVU01147267.1:208-987(-)